MIIYEVEPSKLAEPPDVKRDVAGEEVTGEIDDLEERQGGMGPEMACQPEMVREERWVRLQMAGEIEPDIEVVRLIRRWGRGRSRRPRRVMSTTRRVVRSQWTPNQW